MHERTQATFAQLDAVEWFSAVGKRDTEAAVVLSSWHEAIESCASVEWENLCLEALNRYCEKVAARSPDRFQQWNAIVEDIKRVSMPLVAGKIERVVRENELPQVFADTVNWDILGVAMESEYADVFPPGFYASQAYWYTKGHFPCGWLGNFPDGKLIIF